MGKQIEVVWDQDLVSLQEEKSNNWKDMRKGP